MNGACSARLVFAGRFDPQAFSKEAGINPTGFHQRGDFVKGSIAQYEDDQWIVATPTRRVGRCEDVLFDLYSMISPHAQRLHYLAQLHALRTTIRLVVAVEGEGPLPILELSPEVLRRAEALGATLTIQMVRIDAPPAT